MKQEQSCQILSDFRPSFIAWAGHTTLQDRVLSNIIRERFRTEVVNIKIDEIPTFLNSSEHSLIILNCEGLECKGIAQVVKCSRRRARNALFKVKPRDVREMDEVWGNVSAIFTEDVTPEVFLNGLGHVLRGGLWLPRYVMEGLLLAPRGHGDEEDEGASAEARITPKLGKREWQILEKICDGYSNDEIAEKLFVSKHTIKAHLYNIYKKINVRNRVEAANWMKQSSPGRI